MTQNLAPKSAYFDKPAIKTTSDEVLVFSCLKNEAIRLPYFLEYYRSKGVKTFFIIDNASTDGSGEYLKQQPDVQYFYTEMSYKGSSAGRLWMQELCDHYGTGKWCLTVDVDEMFVWPGEEEMQLTDLTTYLDVEGSAGVFSVFLDMYSDKPLAQTIYAPGDPFLDVCPFYETSSYILAPGGNPPYLSIFGGPRGKDFVEDKSATNGPMMKKIPLVKWFEGFSYIFSTHSHKYLTLSDISGAVLHFKFFDFFTDLAAYENKRGDRRQTQDYAHYAETMTGEQMFYSAQSHMYRSSADLIRRGVMRSSQDYKKFVSKAAERGGPAAAQALRRLLPNGPKTPEMHASGRFSIGGVNAIWPFVHNPKVVEQFSDGVANRRYTNRSNFVQQATKAIKVHDFLPDAMLVRVPENVTYRHVNPRLSFAIYCGDTLKKLVPVIPEGGALQVEEGALLPSLFRIPMDWASLANDSEDTLHNVSVHLIPDEVNSDGFLETTLRKNSLRLIGAPLFETSLFLLKPSGNAAEDLAQIDMDGVVEKVEDGHLVGWLKDKVTDDWRNPIAFYINGRFAGNVRPGTLRESLGPDALIYRFPLPLEYFYERGETDLKIEARVLGRGAALRRTPLLMTGGGRDFNWDRSTSSWKGTVFDLGLDD